jgi:predicted RNA binding protein YcfA (HicA-like mRNA interferase family)
VKARELRRILKLYACLEVRQKGSHIRVECGEGGCVTTVPVHAGEDLGKGLLAQIERDLEICLGKGWLRKGRK